MDLVTSAQDQAAIAPSEVIDLLTAGNERFVAATPRARDLLAQAAATATGQFPVAAVLGCIDSRVPVEVVLDQGIGDVFVARSAGNVVDDDVLGGLEFATELAGAKAVIVLGHSSCGAVKGACDGAELGHLTGLLARIRPAIREVAGDELPGSDDAEVVQSVVEANVRHAVGELTDRSEVLRDRVAAGDLVVRGAVYDLASGRVSWLD